MLFLVGRFWCFFSVLPAKGAPSLVLGDQFLWYVGVSRHRPTDVLGSPNESRAQRKAVGTQYFVAEASLFERSE
jgi:hypothetical protein